MFNCSNPVLAGDRCALRPSRFHVIAVGLACAALALASGCGPNRGAPPLTYEADRVELLRREIEQLPWD